VTLTFNREEARSSYQAYGIFVSDLSFSSYKLVRDGRSTTCIDGRDGVNAMHSVRLLFEQGIGE